MACLRHPKILQLYGCSLTMQAIWIVSEFCSRGSLRMLLNDSTLDLPFLKKVSICLDVADGMLYLHTRSPPIIHRDIKSHNIFITEPSPGHFVAKIGDWGSARAVALTGKVYTVEAVRFLFSLLLFLYCSLCGVFRVAP
jgi:serine/threonine protein kinase